MCRTLFFHLYKFRLSRYDFIRCIFSRHALWQGHSRLRVNKTSSNWRQLQAILKRCICLLLRKQPVSGLWSRQLLFLFYTTCLQLLTAHMNPMQLVYHNFLISKQSKQMRMFVLQFFINHQSPVPFVFIQTAHCYNQNLSTHIHGHFISLCITQTGLSLVHTPTHIYKKDVVAYHHFILLISSFFNTLIAYLVNIPGVWLYHGMYCVVFLKPWHMYWLLAFLVLHCRLIVIVVFVILWYLTLVTR